MQGWLQPGQWQFHQSVPLVFGTPTEAKRHQVHHTGRCPGTRSRPPPQATVRAPPPRDLPTTAFPCPHPPPPPNFATSSSSSPPPSASSASPCCCRAPPLAGRRARRLPPPPSPPCPLPLCCTYGGCVLHLEDVNPPIFPPGSYSPHPSHKRDAASHRDISECAYASTAGVCA